MTFTEAIKLKRQSLEWAASNLTGVLVRRGVSHEEEPRTRVCRGNNKAP